MTESITIIGTGLAGYNLAREFRKYAANVPLRLITADAGEFYSKPMLSNAFASQKAPAQLAMKQVEQMAAELNVEILTYTQVLSIDRAARSLQAQVLPASRQADSELLRLSYSKLVLAVGANTFRPQLSGDATDQVLQVNNLIDYARFRETLALPPRDQSVNKVRVVLLGAGLIGCEFANDFAAAGYAVTLVDIAPWPLSRLLPEAIGQTFERELAKAGIIFHLGVTAQTVNCTDKGYQITLSDGTVLMADVVFSALGLQPQTTLAQQAGLRVNRGIVVNRLLQTSDANIYALGDCAEVEGFVLPFLQPIMQSMRALAQTLAGHPTQVVYPAMPVVVKTPACPLVVAPPSVNAKGNWHIENMGDVQGVDKKALFIGESGDLLGAVLLGAATKERQHLIPQLPALLA